MMINEETFGRLTPSSVRKVLRQFKRKAAAAQKASGNGEGS
jgi:hypothetical protein